MSKIINPIGILGGTFNPIHEGHIAIAEHILNLCQLESIQFIPCFQPPHRDQPNASPDDRLFMVKLAIKNHPAFSVNDYEIRQQKISYTVDTVSYLRKQNPHRSICLIVGDDAFAHFSEWHQWQDILKMVNIIVVARTAQNNTDTLKTLGINKIATIDELHSTHSGGIYFADIHPIPISATQIREDIAVGKKNVRGLNTGVYDYILKHKIYTDRQ